MTYSHPREDESKSMTAWGMYTWNDWATANSETDHLIDTTPQVEHPSLNLVLAGLTKLVQGLSVSETLPNLACACAGRVILLLIT